MMQSDNEALRSSVCCLRSENSILPESHACRDYRKLRIFPHNRENGHNISIVSLANFRPRLLEKRTVWNDENRTHA